MVVWSTAIKPARAPASIAMLHKVMRPSMLSARIALPTLCPLTVQGAAGVVQVRSADRQMWEVGLAANDDGVAKFVGLPSGRYVVSANKTARRVTVPGEEFVRF